MTRPARILRRPTRVRLATQKCRLNHVFSLSIIVVHMGPTSGAVAIRKAWGHIPNVSQSGAPPIMAIYIGDANCVPGSVMVQWLLEGA